MNKLDISKFFKDVRTSIVAHSPEILTGIGIAGMITTTVLAVRATPKALKLIDQKKKEERTDKLPPIDVVKAAWKCYIPAAITGVTSTACLIGANSVHARRSAALATAYKLSETALIEYRDKVVETIGEKKEQTIREKIAQDRVTKHVDGNTEVYITERGDTLFLDPLTKRVFKSDIELIRKAVNQLNYRMTHDIVGFIPLNDFYDEIGLEPTSLGDKLGWTLDNGNGLLEVDTFPAKTKDDKPCLCLDYNIPPHYEHMEYYR